MEKNTGTISACLVVYNEEKIIERCLQSIASLVDEIIIVHDGECKDKTLDIAREYTDKVFVREHVGEAEPHRVFSFEQATGEWIFQIDADEYIDASDREVIRDLIENAGPDIGAFRFKWEMWDGTKAHYVEGFEKMCLFRREAMHYVGIPHAIGSIDGSIERANLFLRHRPAYNNIAWKSFWRKTKKWAPVHAKYFFPELSEYRCFNATPDKWIVYAREVRKYIMRRIAFEPMKMCLGQLKNGLWKSKIGIAVAFQQFVYYLVLYWKIWQIDKKLQSRSSEGIA